MADTIKEKMELFDLKKSWLYDVVVTAAHCPGCFFVRPASITQEEVNSVAVPGELMAEEDITIGKEVVYKVVTPDNTTKYKRGKVSSILRLPDQNLYFITAIDYGRICLGLPASQIYHPGGDATIGPLAVAVQLANCYPEAGGGIENWPMPVVRIFRGLLQDPRVLIAVRFKLEDHTQIVVDMYTRDSNLNVGQWLAENKLASECGDGGISKIQPITNILEFIAPSVEINDELNVRVLHFVSNAEFYVAKEQDYAQYLNNRETFSRYFEEQQELEEDEFAHLRPVGYKCEDTDEFYERAIILDSVSHEDKSLIQLLDNGRKLEAFNNKLKKIDWKKMYEFPAIALYCHTYKDCGYELRAGIQCVIKVKSLGDMYYNPNFVYILSVKNEE